MQDEILKHTEKIYKTVKNPKHSFGEKVKEILIEIFIIVFAVTLSIWLHSWSEHNHQRKEAHEFLKDIKADIAKDLESMQAKKTGLDSVFKSGVHMLDTSALNASSSNFSLNFGLTTFKANDGNYQGFKSSGKIGFIEKDKRAIFGRSYAGEPDQLIRELAQDEAIQEADTLLLTIPNTLGVDYNIHLLSSILKHVAPGLGWR